MIVRLVPVCVFLSVPLVFVFEVQRRIIYVCGSRLLAAVVDIYVCGSPLAGWLPSLSSSIYVFVASVAEQVIVVVINWCMQYHRTLHSPTPNSLDFGFFRVRSLVTQDLQ